ncbi:RHS repeat-associated core domain-containing protein [Actinacidiphila alni]|uniref:RHS repeat-associated core domain-containing protein n=1 Tax=Actinacidiphila alni TaxID=380248 RepID=UPI003456699C
MRERRGVGARRWLIGLSTGALTATLLGTATPAAFATAGTAHHRQQSVSATKPGKASVFQTKKGKARNPVDAASARTRSELAAKPKWPVSADATLAVGAPDDRVKASDVGGLAVRVTARAATSTTTTASPADAPSKVAVHVLNRAAADAAGVDGVLLSVARADHGSEAAKATLDVDYSGFANAYGGDYGSRLRLVQMPACALTTPGRKECRTGTPLTTDNDVKSQTLSASVKVAPAVASVVRSSSTEQATVFAATAAPTSGAGTYTATSLAPSASWQAGGSSGDFTWNYPLTTPPANGGPAPDLALNYDAQSVDGRLPSTNNQPSQVGEGWDLTSSYIERSYDSCNDDGQSKKYDECWKDENATLVLNGKSSQLVKDDKTGAWHLSTDGDERVVRSTGATNGDNDGEYWTVTTTDGTQYVFGKNRLPGWATGKAETNSTWTVPVYGDDSGEPCHGTDFASSACTQAWRWNLDYVVDTHGNAMSYWYTKENNAYGQNGTTTATGTTYVRGGYLARIDYGITASTVFGTAPEQVVFSTRERCLPTDTEPCGTLSPTTAKDWPDVPFDQICNLGTVCKTTPSPTFFSRRRLTGVTTKIWDASLATPAYKDIDAWVLDQSFPDPGDGTSAGLWLKSITRTGKDGTAVSLPPVTFGGIQLANRVDTTHDDIAALIKWRVRTITSETGSVLTVNYSAPQCIAGTTMPSAQDSNTMRCFPVYWQPPTLADHQLDWFHKYVVTQMVTSDPTGGAPLEETDYTYAGGGAWHYPSDDVITLAKNKTWSQWRGYGTVTTTTGDSQSTRTKTVDTYYRGMDGDKQSDGSTRKASVTDSTGTSVTDADPLAGMARESIVYNGTAEVSGKISDPWVHSTANQSVSGTTLTANYIQVAATHTRTDRSSGDPLTTTTSTTYDPATGMATKVNLAGDDSITGDEQCVVTTRASNASAWLIGFPVEEQTFSVGCDKTPTWPVDVVSDTRTLYDSQSFGTAPVRGDATGSQRLHDYTSGTANYQTTATTAYDSQGRATAVTDSASHKISTAYTPATGGPVTQTLTTDPKGYTTTTTLDPGRGQTLATVDVNNKRTDLAYDGLGRLTSMWLPDRVKAVGQTASNVYGYSISNTKASYVSSGQLNNDGSTYLTSYTIYDAQLRARQTQSPAPGGGRLISETKYDSRGLAVEADADYSDGTSASGTLANILSAQPSQTLTTYDGAGRPTKADYYALGTKKWTTSTNYGGDRTTVTPPKGGIASTTVNDALGRPVEKWDYDNGTVSGPHSTITYHYDPAGRMDKAADGQGDTWSYGFDLMGRQISATDPDTGTTTTSYNDLDQVASTTDSRGKTLSYAYDELGRKTGEFDGTTQDAAHQLARWTYDSVAKGQPTSSIRYVGGASGSAYITQVGGYDTLYRPTVTRVTIPSVAGEEGLAGSYTSSTGYNLDGTVQTQSIPAAGGLDGESLIYGYNSTRQVTSLKGLSGYVQNALYTKQGDTAQITLGQSDTDSAKWLQITNAYDDGTRRLNRQLVTDDTSTAPVQDTHYTYDDAGNPTTVDTRADGVNDTQCYTYDGHDRLTGAWATSSDCATAPSTSTVGGPAAYWQTYSYDAIGNRTKEIDHGVTAGAGDTTTTYTPAGAGKAQPHTLTSSTTTSGSGSTSNSYVYDAAGNTTRRTLDGKQQDLAWDDEGNLSSVTNADAGKASYLYDADGNRLLSRDATGTTLYLGSMELRLTKSTKTTAAIRYYTFDGDTVAVRTPTSLSWTLTDRNGTADTAVDATTQAVTRRRSDPFGNPRGTQPADGQWPGNQGFVGGTTDKTTGLTHLGARDYDPIAGRFISADPELVLTDFQQMNGYGYANNNPVTLSDPTGLRPLGAADSAYDNDQYNKDHGAFWTNTSNGGWTYNETHTHHNGRDTFVAVVSIPTHGATRITTAHFRAKPTPPPSVARRIWSGITTVARYTAAALNPAAVLSAGEMGLGLLGVVGGGSGDIAGGVACAFGATCVAGAPAIAGSTILVGAGVTLLGKGANDLINSEKTALSEASGSNSTEKPSEPDSVSPPVFRENTAHIFRSGHPGHLAEDTPENRAIIESAIKPENLRTTKSLKNGGTLDKYFSLLSDGRQAWAEVMNGNIITNGGVNPVPK